MCPLSWFGNFIMCVLFSLWKHYINPTPQIYNTIIISVKNKGNPSKNSCQWQTYYNTKHCVQPERPFEITWFISHYLLREDWLQGSEVLHFWFVPSPLCPGVETCGLPSLPPVLIWQYKPFNFMFSCPFIHNSLSLGEKIDICPQVISFGDLVQKTEKDWGIVLVSTRALTKLQTP